MFVISGATGNTGSVVAETLLDKGQSVRVLVRNAEKAAAWEAKGAEAAIVDILDTHAMAKALEGAKGAYFMLPPDLNNEQFLEDSIKRADAMVEAAKLARLPHAVILSSVGAQYQDRVGPISTIAHFEAALLKASIPLTAVRPGYFLENILDMMPAVIHSDVYPSMIQPLDHKIDMVATRDIGLTLAHALLDPTETRHRVIELKGAQQYSAQDIAATLSAKLGREITAVPVPREAWVPQLVEAGLSRQSAETMAEMHDSINNGRIQFLNPNAQRSQIDLESFIEKNVA